MREHEVGKKILKLKGDESPYVWRIIVTFVE